MQSRNKKTQTQAQAAVKSLRAVGKPDLARRLAEAFDLDIGAQTLDISPDESLADVDEEEVVKSLPHLERFIPASASVPDELDDEKSLNFDTGVFRIRRK